MESSTAGTKKREVLMAQLYLGPTIPQGAPLPEVVGELTNELKGIVAL